MFRFLNNHRHSGKKIKVDGTFQEILELGDFSYGNGLPVEMYDIELIAKAREKRAFNDALPPLSDEACFILRNRFTNEQENREWNQKWINKLKNSCILLNIVKKSNYNGNTKETNQFYQFSLNLFITLIILQ